MKKDENCTQVYDEVQDNKAMVEEDFCEQIQERLGERTSRKY